MIKKITAIITVLMIILTFTFGCNKNKNPSESGSQQGEEFGATWQGSENNKLVKTETATYLDEAEKHIIVIPDFATDEEEFASNELNKLLNESTGIDFYIEKESDITINDGSYYWFVGNTEQSEEKGVIAEYSKLGDSGVIVKTVDNIVFLKG